MDVFSRQLHMPRRWLKLRLGLKSSLKGGFTGKGFKAKPEDLVILEEDDINDHGVWHLRHRSRDSH
jgi:hypothetical protein